MAEKRQRRRVGPPQRGSGPRSPRGRLLAEALAVAEELRRGPRTVAELVGATGLRQRTVYRILSALRDAGWEVEAQPAGRTLAGEGRVPMRYRARRTRAPLAAGVAS